MKIGDKHSEESKLKIGRAQKGKKLSEEHRKKLITFWTGRKHTKETKRKISNANSGNIAWNNGLSGIYHNKKEHSDIEQRRIRAKILGRLNRGKKHTEKTIKKMKGKVPWNKGKKGVQVGWSKGKKLGYNKKQADKIRGKKLSQEHKDKISRGNIGKIVSEKTRIKMSIAQRGKKYSEETIKKMSLANKGRFCGENNPSWCGGKSFEPYDKTFNLKFKNQIRKRDNRVCMACGIHREKLSRALHIHHINYDKLLSIPQNCISLCNSCHTKTGFNRKHWTTFLQNLLNERYGYKYERKDIILDIGGIENDEK